MQSEFMALDAAELGSLPDSVALLRSELQDRVLLNIEKQPFVPDQWLVDLLTEAKILGVLQSLEEDKIDKDECLQVAETVRHTGRKTFAILLWLGRPGLVYRFLQTDQFEQKTRRLLDKRLPMEGAELEHALGIKPRVERSDDDAQAAKLETALYDAFCSIQHMFLVPTLPYTTYPLLFVDSTRLPFLSTPEEDGEVAQGAFGEVRKVALPARVFGGERQIVVRKELKSAGNGAYKDELRCLRLLRTANHNCLLRLYGSYTHRGKHNFLFEEAKHGDLHDFLEAEERPSQFRDSATYYEAFCGLASALEQLHCFSNGQLNLAIIGCHHDLKPRNILVTENRFVIADFGLATMKSADEDPLILAHDRDQYFAAPENIDYGEGRRGRVGPAGDIWSLGCILAEVLAFMHGGRELVRDFRASRELKQTFGSITLIIKSFHDGVGGLNPNVLRFLDDMRDIAETKSAAACDGALPQLATIRWLPRAEVEMLDLIEEMLEIDPSHRPDIKTVAYRLRSIALLKRGEKICSLLLPLRHENSLEFMIERHVFLEWFGHTGRRIVKLNLFTDTSFLDAYSILGDLADELFYLSQADEHLFPSLARFHSLNERLLTFVDPADLGFIRRAVVSNTVRLASVRKADVEVATPASFPVPDETELLATGTHAEILRLLAMNQAQNRIQKMEHQGCPILKESDVTLRPRTQRHINGEKLHRVFNYGTLKRDTDTIGAPVIVEAMDIEVYHAEPARIEIFFDRLENVVSLGRAPETLADLRALNCSGIYLDRENSCLRLVYDYPPSSIGADGRPTHRPVSLAELMLTNGPQSSNGIQNDIITLDDRLRMARDLALAVLAFHNIGWLHKNISSHTVIFFLPVKTVFESKYRPRREPTDKLRPRLKPKPKRRFGPPPGWKSRHPTMTKSTGDSSGKMTPQPQLLNPTVDPPLRLLSLPPPALIGFSHSRPVEPPKLESIMVPPELRELLAYHHPYYADLEHPTRHSMPYRASFDYYSLGMVLLEIGLWEPLRTLSRNIPERDSFREKVLKTDVVRLAGTAGVAYAEAVEACLSDGLEDAGEEWVEERFSVSVVGRLEKLAGSLSE